MIFKDCVATFHKRTLEHHLSQFLEGTCRGVSCTNLGVVRSPPAFLRPPCPVTQQPRSNPGLPHPGRDPWDYRIPVTAHQMVRDARSEAAALWSQRQVLWLLWPILERSGHLLFTCGLFCCGAENLLCSLAWVPVSVSQGQKGRQGLRSD